ncbi:MAG: hypothetical protein ACH346_06805 [Chthoniobacterales bacterium]
MRRKSNFFFIPFACEVTAAQYCDFLNQNAATDLSHLYDDSMATDPEAACIVRVGAPGRWHYQVIASRENFPVVYVNGINEARYCETENCSDDEENNDQLLKSNIRGFSNCQ